MPKQFDQGWKQNQPATLTRAEAEARGFVIWQGNDEAIWYARSQNRADQDYGKVYQITEII